MTFQIRSNYGTKQIQFRPLTDSTHPSDIVPLACISMILGPRWRASGHFVSRARLSFSVYSYRARFILRYANLCWHFRYWQPTNYSGTALSWPIRLTEKVKVVTLRFISLFWNDLTRIILCVGETHLQVLHFQDIYLNLVKKFPDIPGIFI